MAELDVDVVAQAYLFCLLSTTLFTNHGNHADLALLPPLQDLDETRRIIEIWTCEHWVLSMPSLYGFDANATRRTLPHGQAWRFNRRYAHTTSEFSVLRQLLSILSWDWSIKLEQNITATQRVSAAANHLAAFVLGVCAIFVWTQLLVHIPPLFEFNPFAKVKEPNKSEQCPSSVAIA
ncbi:hypothetical protein JCGZ_26526 [Jatropha curcas]|uniref:Aminotransferase-like plant mobile domain-containing protein n=1 Tax=Jatropha curcas TaxID=180498 RepID=A0A067JL01_JATCU|nr:hypothetical protein JCGZ_26526 [Jatropha curcas]